jgi:hypothetical protein
LVGYSDKGYQGPGEVVVYKIVYYIVIMPQTIRIEPEAHTILAEIARETHTTLSETLSRAVMAYRRDVFMQGLAGDFAALGANPEQWADEQAERLAWDQTNADGLESE